MSEFPVIPLALIGVGSSLFSGVFYYLYGEKQKEVQKLKKIPVFKPDQLLLKVLQATPLKRLQYVAVEGMVQADGEPLASQFVPRCSGVIQKISVEEKWKYWDSLTSTWNFRTKHQKETNNSVPFSLVNPSAYIPDVSVKVHNPLEAGGSFLEQVHYNVKHAEKGALDMVAEVLSGEKPVAKHEREELLRVGSTLTGFGEVVMEGGQVARLQSPKDGRKFILVPTDHKSFIERHEATASMWMKLSAVTGITGASILASVVYAIKNRDER